MEPGHSFRKDSEDTIKTMLQEAGLNQEKFFAIMIQIREIIDNGTPVELDFLHNLLEGAIASINDKQ
jgi:hypothetical protein